MVMRQQAMCNTLFGTLATSHCSPSAAWRPCFPVVFALSCMAWCSVGCGAKVLVPNEADALREELTTRTSERNAARARVAELESEIAQLTQRQSQVVNPEAAAATPALAAVAISSLSTARMTDDGQATLAVVLTPTDGLGRFLQVTGTLEISCAMLVPGAAPQPLPPRSIGPKELRESYRSGFMGTHYTIELPCEWKKPDAQPATQPATQSVTRPATGVAVSTVFTDAWTGKSFASTATVPMVPIDRLAAPSGRSPTEPAPR
jgi:hypothetical protein